MGPAKKGRGPHICVVSYSMQSQQGDIANNMAHAAKQRKNHAEADTAARTTVGPTGRHGNEYLADSRKLEEIGYRGGLQRLGCRWREAKIIEPGDGFVRAGRDSVTQNH